MPEEFQHIVRIAETDIDGALELEYALTKIKGVGIRLANIIAERADLDPNRRLGFLSDAEVKRIKDVIQDPSQYDLPYWLLNRSRDRDTGKDLHLVGSDLVLQTKSDIDHMKKIKSWKGIRHSLGLKVRGQRTRTTGRKGRVVGVKKKRALMKLKEEEKERV
ncbi:30S ribosomal protein S13 [Candidatus Bathyarchaeota archaeon]|nr:30S ribosomal protein S13 [Candidatus Bathyarchaeota archaeon]NIU81558.1 30S ribosomal protein S13 [Candidatus Bathyarchaeota archaeon]NIV68194.1 30S ribosomal protein S13 [Candidatus Bathyarchaeota archaeon]NIW16576.1 30S ribosomal protein S13 [Candidatus Bathyarchaeota archaeon]NIW34795.1 30S ribosomal protein S13 [Candidatus Bathyarchaeota archaeon]